MSRLRTVLLLLLIACLTAACGSLELRPDETTAAEWTQAGNPGPLITSDRGLVWRGGGMLIQNIAGDEEARGSAEDAWERAQALFATVGEDELVDPTVPADRLLWRLFHEDGVRLFRPKPLRAFCRCSTERILSVLQSFPPEERVEMVEPDGKIRVTCEYCSRVYDVAPEDVGV